MTPALQAYADYLQSLTPESLGRLETFVTDDVRFIDPFNDVTGVASMRRVFEEMFSALGDVGFDVEQAFGDGDGGMLHWQFSATLRGRPWRFHGSSLVRFAPDGRVCFHRDDWDTGRNFYEKLPVIGWIPKLIRRRLQIG